MPSTRPATQNSLEVGLHPFQGTGRSLLCKYFRLFISTSNPVCMSWGKLLKTKTPVIIHIRPLQPEVCEARRNLTAASLVWPELRVERLRVLRVLWLHCGRGRNVAVASTRFWLPSWPTWRNAFLGPTRCNTHTRTHGSEVCKSPSPFTSFPWCSSKCSKTISASLLTLLRNSWPFSENNWSKILPSYFKYLQSYGLSKYLLGIISGLT